jgi:hypothetical protein
MAALLADELPGLATKANDAVRARTLPPILALGGPIRELHAIAGEVLSHLLRV